MKEGVWSDPVRRMARVTTVCTDGTAPRSALVRLIDRSCTVSAVPAAVGVARLMESFGV